MYKFYREKIKLLYELTPKIRTYKYYNKKNVFFTYYRENYQNMWETEEMRPSS